jgi:hypothetical protein
VLNNMLNVSYYCYPFRQRVWTLGSHGEPTHVSCPYASYSLEEETDASYIHISWITVTHAMKEKGRELRW